MHLQPLHSEDRPDPLWRGPRLLFVLLVTAGIALLGIGAIAIICQYLVPPIAQTPEFFAQYTIPGPFFFAGQPAKTAAYQLGCMATPFLLALGFWTARRWGKQLSDGTIDRVNIAGIIVYLLAMVSCALPIVYCPNPPFWILPPSWILLPMGYTHPFYKPERILFLLVSSAIAFFLLASPVSRRNANWAMVPLLIAWLALIPSRFYVPSEIDDAPRYLYHLNSVLDALSQSVNGHHMLIDFPHIYGGYVEMLAPIIRIFPRDISVLIATLAIPNIVGILCLLCTARLVIRHPAFLFLAGLTLLGTDFLSSIIDVNYGFLTARLVFPPVGLLAATLYFRDPSLLRYGVTTLVAALASIWNLDTGIVLWGSWIVTLLAMAAARRDVMGIVRHLVTQVAALALAWAGFFLYLRLVSGQWPDVGLLFYFQKLVVDSGYFCLPLLFPDMWVFILTLYLVGLVIAFCSVVRQNGTWPVAVILMYSIFGIGFFSYFMGRSAPSNLIGVSFPAVLLAGIYCSEVEARMHEGSLPKNTRFLLLPCKIALFWWAFLMVAGMPDFMVKSAHVLTHWNNPEMSPLRAKIAFVTQEVAPREKGVFFLSNHSGIYYYVSDTVRPLKIPGNIELLRTREMEVLVAAIRQHELSKIFVDENFYEIQMYRPDVYDELRDALMKNYQEAAAGPTGRLVLYTPR